MTERLQRRSFIEERSHLSRGSVHPPLSVLPIDYIADCLPHTIIIEIILKNSLNKIFIYLINSAWCMLAERTQPSYTAFGTPNTDPSRKVSLVDVVAVPSSDPGVAEMLLPGNSTLTDSVDTLRAPGCNSSRGSEGGGASDLR